MICHSSLTLGAPVETVVSFERKSLSTAESSCAEDAKTADSSPHVLHSSPPITKLIHIIEVSLGCLPLCNFIIYSSPQTASRDPIPHKYNFYPYSSTSYFYTVSISNYIHLYQVIITVMS